MAGGCLCSEESEHAEAGLPKEESTVAVITTDFAMQVWY